MLFRFIRRRNTLQRALQAAVASHRAPLLRALLARHGDSAFAAALAAASGRVIADALSMLAPADRGRVQRKLPRTAQQRCEQAGGMPSQPGQVHVRSGRLAVAQLSCRTAILRFLTPWFARKPRHEHR